MQSSSALGQGNDAASVAFFSRLPACHQVVTQRAKAMFQMPMDLPQEEGLILAACRVQTLKSPIA